MNLSRVGYVIACCGLSVLLAPSRAETACIEYEFKTGEGCVTMESIGCAKLKFHCDGAYKGVTDISKCGTICTGGCNGWCTPEVPPAVMNCAEDACGQVDSNNCINDGCPAVPDPSQPQCKCASARCDVGQEVICTEESAEAGACFPEATCSGPAVTATCGDQPIVPNSASEICNDGLDNNCNYLIDEGCAPPENGKQPNAGRGGGEGVCSQFADGLDAAGADPIHLESRAAVTEPFTDFSVDGLVTMGITRTYSSADISVRGSGLGQSFGRGWHHDWEATLVCTNSEFCRITQGISRGMNFKRRGVAQGVGEYAAETWTVYERSDSGDPEFTEGDVLARRPTGEFILYRTDGREFEFKTDCGLDHCSTTDNYCLDPWSGGRAHLSRVTDERKNSIVVSYDRPSGVLLSLTDDVGHTLKLLGPSNACSTGLATSLVYDGSTYVTYQYDTNNRELEVVRQWTPDAHGPVLRSYEYGKLGYLTRVRNESGDPIVEFGYDSANYASSVIDAKSSVTVTYPTPATLVVSERSYTSSKSTSQTRDRGRPTTVAWDGRSRSLAWRSHVLSCREDADGRIHWFDVDGRGRVTRHALYAAGTYACGTGAPPASGLVPLLEEWFEYGLRHEVAAGVFVDLKTVTSVARRSVLGEGPYSGGANPNLTVRSTDYSQVRAPGDPSDYSCTAGGAPFPGLVPCREVVTGYTLDDRNAIVPEEHTTYYSYDGRGRVVRVIGPVITGASVTPGAVEPVREFSYWPDSGAPEDIHRLGRLRELRRFPGGSHGLVLVTSFDYDVFGPYQIVEPGNRTQLVVKDGRGRAIAVATPDGRVRALRYYDGGAPRAIVQPSGATRRFGYDLRGRVATVEAFSSDPESAYPTTPEGNVVQAVWVESREYDPAGNAVRVERRDARGVVRWRQVREYGADHSVLRELHPSSTAAAARWDYEASGLLREFADEEGRGVELIRDPLGRVGVVRRSGFSPSGATISVDAATYAYEGDRESLRSVTDAAGRTVFYQHDDFGRLLSVDSPTAFRAGPARYRYDARGNIVARTWGTTTTVYRYDGLGRLTNVDATSSAGAPAVSYVMRYDEDAGAIGRLTSVADGNQVTSYAYDDVGRVRFETVTLVAGPTLVTEYRYDADGNADIVVYPSGLVVKLERDLATGRVSAVRDLSTGAALASGIEYLPGGPIERLVYGNGTSLTRTYDLRYQPLGIQSGPVALAYVPTLAGDVATITSEFGEERFGYDFADRLVTRKTTTGIRSEPLAFVYAGDRLTQAFPSGSTIPRLAFAYDDQSDVSAISRYDDTGGALASTICLVHDALGRLVLVGYAPPGSGGPDVLACRSEADVQEVIARFTYDAMGRRVSRRDADGRWTYFAFDLQGNPSSEVLISGDGSVPARDYVFLEGSPLVQVEYPGPTPSGGAPYFFHVDHLNRPRALTSASGQVVWKSNVLPSGEGIEQIEPDSASGRVVVTNLRLPGQYDERLLASVGLQGPYYNWNRWYLPGVGRYLEPDPIAMAGGFNGEFGPDWYNYGSSNPLTNIDPAGLKTFRCRTPLHAFGGTGTRSGPDTWGNPFYHQFSCVVRDGRVQCGGQDRTGSAGGSPGKPSDDKYDEKNCKQTRPDDDCYEKCLVEEWSRQRPWYGIPFGTDCQEYDDEANDRCRKQCDATKRWWWPW